MSGRSGDEIDVAAYLRRIGYVGPLEPTVETLRGLHAAHRLTVPYENLDVTLRRPLVHTPRASSRRSSGGAGAGGATS